MVTGTQPDAPPTDNIRMNENTSSDTPGQILPTQLPPSWRRARPLVTGGRFRAFGAARRDLWHPGAEYIDAEARHPSVPSKLARRIDHRGLPAHKVGAFWKVKPSESDDWLRAGGAEAPEEESGR
jgi:hypothetical protein